ncbi:TonB-dependent receptor [Novosphingobium aquae]|uniref:TonB-dependent receptor n=1 Tax=Novosphingobium aquae TaxID=3133435 RepID=A0ABU8S9B1_9SPHN
MKKLTMARLFAAASMVSLAISGNSASAQTAAPEGEEANGIADIVVTAQKRSESSQTVPASITALDDKALDLRQISSVSDLQGQVPSLVVGELFGTNLITLRGISTGQTSGSEDPSVATHINGAYQPRSRSIDVAMVDLQRVEVLSGPQGTLYGRNATGGAVNYVLRGPSDTFEGELTGRAANYERFGISGSVSGPIGDSVGIRVTGLYDNQAEGFSRVLNANAPKDRLEENRVYGGRVVVEAKPSDRVTITVEGIGLNTKSSTAFFPFGQSIAPAINAAVQPQTYLAHEIYTDENAQLNSQYYQGIATINAELSDNVSIKSISAYQDYHQLMVIDSDGSATSPKLRTATNQVTDSQTFTQEFNVNTKLIDGRLNSIFGFFYFHDDIDLQTDLTTFRSFSAATGSLNPFTSVLSFHTFQKARSYAFFTDHTFSVTDSIRLIAGLRYNHDEKTAQQSFFFNGNPVLAPTTINKIVFESWTPRFGFQVDVAPRVMLYGTYSKGFKSGGFASNVNAVNPFNPEKISGGEIGVKSELADRRIRLNLSGYYYDYSDLQVQNAVLVNGIPSFRVRNAAKSRIYGVEAQLQAMLSDNFKLDIAGMVQSAKYTDFSTCNNTLVVGTCTAAANTTLINLKGNWLNRAPNYTVNVGLEYKTEVGSAGELTLRGESLFSGTVHFDEFASALVTQKAYSLQNFYVSFTPTSDRFTLRAYVKNIGDTDYKTSGFFQTATLQQAGNWGAPRTFGAEATIRF